jgi:hypothetical protein
MSQTTSPDDGTRSSFRNVLFFFCVCFLEYETMDKAQKPSNPVKLGRCSTTLKYISLPSRVAQGSRDSSVCIAMRYGLGGHGSIPARSKICLQHVVQTGSGSHPTSYPMDVGGGGVKLTTHFHLVSRWRMMGLYFHTPTCVHGFVLN